MLRPFPALATIGLALLAAGLADAGRGVGLVGLLGTLGVHGLAAASASRDRARIGESSGRLGLPGWVAAQGEKNAVKAAVLAALGASLALCLTGCAGLAGAGGWGSALLSANLGFQAGAFAGEALAMAAQARLLRDLAGSPGGLSGL